MYTHKALNGLVIASLLLATLLTGAGTRQTRALEALKALKRAEGDEWVAAPGDGQDPSVDEFHAAPVALAGGSHSWDSDADFDRGAFDFTEVVSGTGQVTLARRWSDSSKANDSDSGFRGYPSLAAGANGHVYLAWEDDRAGGSYDVYFASSADKAATWSSNVQVNGGCCVQGAPSLAVDGSGTLYAAWNDDRGGNADIYFSKSIDGGATWLTNTSVISEPIPATQFYPSLAVGGSGALYVAWQDNRNTDWDVYFSKSTDGGATWSANIRLNDDAVLASQAPPSLIAVGDDTVYVGWQDDRAGHNDIYVVSSGNGGDSWSGNVKVNDDTASAHQYNPSLAVDASGHVHVAWQDFRDGDPQIFVSQSTDGGQTWSSNVRASNSPAHVSNPSLTIDAGGKMWVAWQDGRNDDSDPMDGNKDVFLAYSTDGGQTWGADVRLNTDSNLDDQTNPSLAADVEGAVYASWDDPGNGICTSHWPAGYYVAGDYAATVHDAGDIVAWGSLVWTDTVPAGTAITITVRVGNTPAPDTHWSDWLTLAGSPADLTGLPPSRYLQWRALLASSLPTATPSLDAVTLNWDAQPYTTVDENVYTSAMWRTANSPYLITKNLLVYEGASLTIEPGVTVWFSDTYALQVLGGLEALGTATQPITFTSWHVQGQPGDWGAIAFADTATDATFDLNGNYVDGSALQYATVEHAGSGSFSHAIDARNTTLYVDHCTIQHNGASGLWAGGAGSSITRNTIRENHDAQASYHGIVNHGASTTISGNAISGNSGQGISNSALATTINGNTISHNSGHGITNHGESVVLRGNTISSNSEMGIVNSGDSVTVSDNTISDNSGSGIEWDGGSGDVSYNTIVSNTAGGIYVFMNYPTIHHNAVQGNGGYALYHESAGGSSRLDARYNWWGSADEAAIRSTIYDWFDDPAKGIVDYSPYLLKRPDLKPGGINLDGPTSGLVNTPASFDASVYPLAVLTPLTFTWQATGQTTAIHVRDVLQDSASFSWSTTGPKTITVTVQNSEGITQSTHTIEIVESSTFDAFESDDACPQAKEIPTDGTTQVHTFHNPAETDWAFFVATAGTTYIIEAIAPDDSEADVALEVYDSCDGAAQEGQNNAFSPDISLSFAAPEDGPLYLRLSDNRSSAGERAASYYLSVRALAGTASTGTVIIVAGKNKSNDPLQPNIYHVTNTAYRTFQANGYTDDTITYLAPDPSLDADSDGDADVDAVSTKTSLQDAINSAALVVDDAHPLTLFMMDHGGYDVFYLNLLGNYSETVSAYELDGWLDTLQAGKPNLKINVIIEACHSGSFIDLAQTLSGPNRVVIASTGAYPVAYASDQGAVFSDNFLGALGRGMSLYGSFEEARWATRQAHPDQTPWLDDDGDGTPNGSADGLEAAQRGFAFAGTLLGENWPPYIAQATVDSLSGTIQTQVQVHSSKSVSEVWALIYPPSYVPPESGEDMIRESVPRVTLAAQGNGSYSGQYAFTQQGAYRVVVYVTDSTGLGARPRAAQGGAWNRVYLPVIIK